MATKTVVIVGAGQAAAVCALALRERNFDGPITIIGEEAHPPYERPELSKKLVTGECNLGSVTILDRARAESLGIRLVTGCTVESLDRPAQIVRTDAGDFAYDWLVLATGGRARLLDRASATGLPTLVVRTADDAMRLQRHIGPDGHVAVIGGGWLGLELAASCRKSGMQVDVLEGSERLCGRVAPEGLSRALQTLHLENGVRVRCGQAVTFHPGALVLGQKTEIRPDFLVIAIGMDANDRLAAEAGLETERGILVDAAFQTEDPHILAIGDCAARRMPEGQAVRVESWQNANHSALVAACGISGVTPPPAEPLWFWSDQFGTRLQMAGNLSATDEIIERVTGPDDRMAFHLHCGRLTGVWAFNAVRDFAIARRWLSQGARLSPAFLSDAGRPLKNALVT
jgi:3-phenylpropionate/trans-cinnamate dioxygenase ferredoxin reductase component